MKEEEEEEETGRRKRLAGAGGDGKDEGGDCQEKGTGREYREGGDCMQHALSVFMIEDTNLDHAILLHTLRTKSTSKNLFVASACHKQKTILSTWKDQWYLEAP